MCLATRTQLDGPVPFAGDVQLLGLPCDPESERLAEVSIARAAGVADMPELWRSERLLLNWHLISASSGSFGQLAPRQSPGDAAWLLAWASI